MSLAPAPSPSAGAQAPTHHDGGERTAALLAAHVPLTLLLDLVDPFGPHSLELLAAEPGSADWLFSS